MRPAVTVRLLSAIAIRPNLLRPRAPCPLSLYNTTDLRPFLLSPRPAALESVVDTTRCVCVPLSAIAIWPPCCARVPLVRCHYTTLPTCAPFCCRHGQPHSSLLSMRLDLLCLCALVRRRYTANPLRPCAPHLMSLYDITDLWPPQIFCCCCGLLPPRPLSM